MLPWTSSFAIFMRLILIVDKWLQNATAFSLFKLFTVIYLGKLTIKGWNVFSLVHKVVISSEVQSPEGVIFLNLQHLSPWALLLVPGSFFSPVFLARVVFVSFSSWFLHYFRLLEKHEVLDSTTVSATSGLARMRRIFLRCSYSWNLMFCFQVTRKCVHFSLFTCFTRSKGKLPLTPQ